MVTLMLLVPCYLFIANRVAVGTVHAPVLPWDRAVPLQPTWALIYGALYMFLIVLPVLVVREEEHIRRTFWAYLAVWLTAYVCFLVYPTVAPRPPRVVGDGFAVWGLRFLYDADPPYNCFPSLHVAHSFVSALTCYRLHRRLGLAALLERERTGRGRRSRRPRHHGRRERELHVLDRARMDAPPAKRRLGDVEGGERDGAGGAGEHPAAGQPAQGPEQHERTSSGAASGAEGPSATG